MKLFLSWSGDKSKALARSLNHGLPMTVRSLEPWISDRDILPGAYWTSTLAKHLSTLASAASLGHYQTL